MVNMKKISMIALTILTLGVTSCDMDKMPYDAVPTEEALTTIVGFEEARAGIYSVYLGLTGGSYVLAPEVQADAFNAVADFSNKYGELHRWTFESTNSTVEQSGRTTMPLSDVSTSLLTGSVRSMRIRKSN